MLSLLTLALLTVFFLGRFSSSRTSTTTPYTTNIRSPKSRRGDEGPLLDSIQEGTATGDEAQCASTRYVDDMFDNEGIDYEGNTESSEGPSDDVSSRGFTFDGVRYFADKCLVQGSERLEVVSRLKLKSQDKKKTLIEHNDQVAYLARDVCALGHFPKDFAHMHSWQELRKSRGARRRRSNGTLTHSAQYVFGIENSEKREVRIPTPEEKDIVERHADGRIDALVIGHRCATRDPTRIVNKRTPVFHNVLVHWVRAITENFSFLRPDHEAKQSSERKSSEVSVVMYEDLQTEVHCYPLMIEREERWRWFPTYSIAHSFRQKMWRYLKLDYSALHAQRHTTPFEKQKKLQVLVLHRDEDRHFDERRVVDFLASKFGAVATFRYEQYDSPPNPSKITKDNNVTVPLHTDQLKQMFQSDILIAAHGAALSNVVVMQPGAVVVELFPHNFRYYMYEELSRVMSLNYVAYEGEVVTPRGCCKQRSWKGGDSLTPQDAGQGGVKEVNDIRVALNGKRDCKKCSIEVRDEVWYQLVKNAMASVWLRNSRLSDVHDFDVRR